MGADIIQNNLKAYYAGLFNINTDSTKRKILSVKERKVKTAFKAIKTHKGDAQTFRGTVVIPDYMQLKPITLNCIVHVKPCAQENKTVVFYELSPQPFSHNIWASFTQLWLGFKCRDK